MTGVQLLAFASCLALALSHQGWALDEEIVRHPDQAIVEAYRSSDKAVEGLRTRIASTHDQEDRILALRHLGRAYPLAGEITARAYVADENADVAFTAVQILMGATVMSSHSMAKHRTVLPRIAYTMERHRRSIAALRPAVIDRRKRIRQAAVTFLASLSDIPALDMISDDQNGLYSDLQIANFVTLANGKVAPTYLKKFLGRGEFEAQMTAISYLSAIPEWRQQIRDIYFFNSDASIELRKYSAVKLSKNDIEFWDYALDVVMVGKFNSDLLATILEIIQIQFDRDQFDVSTARRYANEMKSYTSGRFPYIPSDSIQTMKSLSQRLHVYSGNNTAR